MRVKQASVKPVSVKQRQSQQDVLERRESLRRTANLLRLEGDYVGAQEAEQQLKHLSDELPTGLARHQQKEKSAA